MPLHERGPVRIHYEEVGSGFPLLLIPGGGLNSALSSWQTASPFNPMERYKDDFRCICADLRNANPGRSSGPLEIDRPWDAYADDQLGLMDHLGIGEFMVMGFCIGGPMIHNLIRRAPDRVVAAAMMQPSGFRPELPDLFYQNNMKGWGPPLCEKRSDVTMDMVHNFLTSMYTKRADFVFTVSRDFVRSIKTPLLIAPDDVPAHPYKVAMEVASLAPNAEVTIYPWKDSQEHIDEVVEHARRFLKAHEPVTAGRQGLRRRPLRELRELRHDRAVRRRSPEPHGHNGDRAPQARTDHRRHGHRAALRDRHPGRPASARAHGTGPADQSGHAGRRDQLQPDRLRAPGRQRQGRGALGQPERAGHDGAQRPLQVQGRWPQRLLLHLHHPRRQPALGPAVEGHRPSGADR